MTEGSIFPSNDKYLPLYAGDSILLKTNQQLIPLKTNQQLIPIHLWQEKKK